MTFDTLGLDPSLLRAVHDLGWPKPTPIQLDAIPPARDGRDLLACAMTGSGKTAAFLLPILNGLIGKPRGVTRALVLTPTRELAAQVETNARDYARFTNLNVGVVYGGVPLPPQLTVCGDTPEIEPFAPAVYVSVYGPLIAKFAVTLMSAVTFVSVRGFEVEPSLQFTKW